MDRDSRDAGNALCRHIWWRCRQHEHAALEGRDRIFLTVKHIQRLLRAVNATNTGEKAAAKALRTMKERGWIVDTGDVKLPRRSQTSTARARRYGAPAQPEGGRDAQPTLQRSFWWPVYRVPAITDVMAAKMPLGAYAQVFDLPHHLASLSAFLSRQGLLPRTPRRASPNPGSVQRVFLHSGPP